MRRFDQGEGTIKSRPLPSAGDAVRAIRAGGGRVLAAAVLAAFLLLARPPTAEAATFAVNSNGDGGDAAPGNGVCATATGACTLRAAVQENNALGGGHTVTVPAMTIVLQTQLVVNKSIAVQGAGQGATILDGGNPNTAQRSVRGFFFTLRSGTHSVSNLTVRNMGVTYATDPVVETVLKGVGGAILNLATLTLSGVTLTGNRADQGGGIYNNFDIAAGGGEYIIPTVIMNNVTLSYNTATSAVFGQGGGGLFNGAAINGNGVHILYNSALQGGGFYNNNPHWEGVVYQVSLTAFEISGNSAVDVGGGIDNDLGTIVLINGTVSDNTAMVAAGGIANNYAQVGTPTHMTLSDVAISRNVVPTAGGLGGGIVNIETMVLNRVTINANRANYGAGIHNGNDYGSPNSLSLTNVTVSGNVGTTFGARQARGGGIFNTFNGVLDSNNATVTLNSAVAGGGLDTQVNPRPGNSATLRNSILAGNIADPGWGPDCQGPIVSGNYNLIGSTTGCVFAPGGGDRLNLSPQLKPLAIYGGPTATHALFPTSPALNAGNPAAPGGGGACAPIDQRGVVRPQGPQCDMGAFEFRPVLDGGGVRLYLPLIRR